MPSLDPLGPRGSPEPVSPSHIHSCSMRGVVGTPKALLVSVELSTQDACSKRGFLLMA